MKFWGRQELFVGKVARNVSPKCHPERAAILGTDLCVVSAGHDTAGLSPVSMRRGGNLFVGRGFTSRRRSRTRGALPILLICSLARLRCIRHRRRLARSLSRRRAGAIFKSRHRSNEKDPTAFAVGSFSLAEMERFELSRRYTRPTPLAGAPLRPLEYISMYA